MSPLPLPIRLAAGLTVVALERARRLPQDAAEWPMSAVSQALQLSMRVQQRITELAIKGDEALAGLREAEEDPPWAVFDEDLPTPTYLRPARSEFDGRDDGDEDLDLEVWDDALRAPADALDAWGDAPDATDATDATETAGTRHAADGHGGPDALPSYPELSLPSVRARLRKLTVTDLDELLAYERGHGDRPEFVRMLTNRIATVRTRG